MSTHQPMQCPECGEDAVNRSATDLVPWEAHGMTRPAWSHKDGSSLCPVAGPSGGFRPAQPQRRHADPGDRFEPLHDSEGQLIEGPAKTSGPAQPVGHADAGSGRIGEYLKVAIARLRVTRLQPTAERDREAGA
jgi:hypothetical protein